MVLADGLGSVPLPAAENIKLSLNGRPDLLINTHPTTRKLLQTHCDGGKLHMHQMKDGSIRASGDFSAGNVGEDPEKMADELFATLKPSFKNGDDPEFGNFTIGVWPDPEDRYQIWIN
ncbi:hypothetical protein D7B24_001043 [Verticillium nonalfalfae]|nr:uncharacterized protein D7B24_001043 [Verticillium nonalfalfae]RNJ59805.1 hypothetical protein D7B24_001043 [Verticillium nonalfalfae]